MPGDVEQALMDRLQGAMLELGPGLAFVGHQVRLTVPDDASDRLTSSTSTCCSSTSSSCDASWTSSRSGSSAND